MKTNIGLLVGGLVLLLGSTASATTLCGTANTSGGSANFTVSSPGPGGSVVLNGDGSATITCNGLNVIPPSDTLTAIDVTIIDNGNTSNDLLSQITWTWSYSGPNLNPSNPSGTYSEDGISGDQFGACFNHPGGSLTCNGTTTFTPQTTYNNLSVPNLSFTVSAADTGPSGDGLLNGGGGATATVLIQFDYVPTSSIPEPTVLLLIGSGLVGLGVFARRKRQQ
jgi:hypothetical protein